MPNRHILAVSKLEEFKAWLSQKGWQLQDTKGYWEVLRATRNGRKRPFIIYERMDTNNGTPLVHLTVEDRDVQIVYSFLHDKKKNNGRE